MQEEIMWWKLRISDAFESNWEKFLQNAISQALSPTFFLFISHEMFKDLIKLKHEIPPDCDEYQASNITKEEENAWRYVSGYVC